MNAPASAVEPVLRIENLTVAFRVEDHWREVVKNLSLTVNAGETLAIVGESGSGKSVTSMAIMRLLNMRHARVSGKVLLNGVDLLTLSESAMRDIRGNAVAMIFQEPMTSLNPSFTIGNQIAEALINHRKISKRVAREETIRLLEKVRIPNAAKRFNDYPHHFSGGMRQRVMIAMALALRPKLLIADEPTTALDVTIQGQILDLIKTLQEEEGTAVLFITHDMGVVAEVSDRTLVMYQGDVMETGTTAAIFSAPAADYTRTLIATVPQLGAMRGITGPRKFSFDQRDASETNAVSTSQQPLLSVKNLSTRFSIHEGVFSRKTGAVHAVENISFDLMPGETLSLVGESGCGKSTTGRSLTRLVTPDAGEVAFDGYDVLNLSVHELRTLRRAMQMIFQDPFASLNPRMSVLEALTEPFLQHRLGSKTEARTKAASLMERVGLSADMMKRYPHEFSGGQRQRICIARALMLDPKMIIADESVSALDVTVKAQIINLLLDLQQSLGLSYLFISHDMAVVERISHRVAVMLLGEIVEIGPRAAIFENPQHDYTRKLLSSVPVPDPARRHVKRQIDISELKSPVRALGFVPEARRYREVSEGHWVME
ncbi:MULTISPECIES: ABC transporter ATP-binding protein [Pantoea]|uniref:Glutathione import ATP-binding protein GsiA n=1 Tax=Pantoea endophytica TaxID=92488 RepID=A0ABX4STI6_9GAMM|nr:MULTISPECIES: ABC transporter ATP-binding protein [Pantoea]PLR25717.1 glutathione ABC transporter ATP-binding protein GsiA [Pantoea endophytica]QCP62003.1 ABC transporter ATP-binding protein [Pantoea sp. SO10]